MPDILLNNAGGLPPLLSPKLAAQLVGLSVKTLANMRCAGNGPQFIRYGGKRGRINYRSSDLITWRDSHLRSSTSEVI